MHSFDKLISKNLLQPQRNMPPRRRSTFSLARTKLKKPRKSTSESSRLLAEWEEAEEEWCEDECNHLSHALTQTASTSALEDGLLASVQDDGNSSACDDGLDPEPVVEELEVETDGYDSETSVEFQVEEDVQARGHNNRQRRIREERKWAEIIERMFKAFMQCQTQTRQWTHPESRNRDLKAICSCSMAKEHVRQVDVYDILSM